MAGLQTMTLTERMNDINSDGLQEYTFQEACNRYLKIAGTINTVDYTNIALDKYTPEEAFSIILHEANLRSKDLTELINHMGGDGLHDYTATEALNKEDAITEG
tara:strand:- start:2781 stop:3092 length:312 start_codon:yes stop_codon:yes gene_type:complete